MSGPTKKQKGKSNETKANEPQIEPQKLQEICRGFSQDEHTLTPHARRLAAIGKMVCTRPLTGYPVPGGKLVFAREDGYTGHSVQVSCGQCQGCRLERSRQWAVRCMHEAQMHQQNSFLTLTYNDENLPSDHSIDLDHWQKFAKKLRKHLKNNPENNSDNFRYYHCGEYGLEGRPHYHAILFGIDFSTDRKPWKMVRGNQLYISETLEKIWGKGFTSIGSVTFQSAAYVARYIMKKVTGTAANHFYRWQNYDTGEEHTIKPEYSTMSRRPGLGQSWYEKYKNEIYDHDNVIVNGKKTQPPKFYDGKFQNDEPELYETIYNRRQSQMENNKSEHTPERLLVKEKIINERLKQLTRQ